MNSLASINISGTQNSCTKGIVGVQMEDMLMCDGPGLIDSRGPEHDMANILGVVRTA